MEVLFYAPELSCGGLTGQIKEEWTVQITIDGEEKQMTLKFNLN
jgi:hypothetical protein